MNRYACTGCGALTADPRCATVRLPSRGYAFVCAECTARADNDPTFRRSVEIAAAAGQALPEVRRVFASLGVAVPTTLDEFDVALRLPKFPACSECTSMDSVAPAAWV